MVVGWGPSTGILHGLAVHWLWVGAPVHGMGWLYIVKVGCTWLWVGALVQVYYMGWLYTGCGLGPQYMVWVGCTL